MAAQVHVDPTLVVCSGVPLRSSWLQVAAGDMFDAAAVGENYEATCARKCRAPGQAPPTASPPSFLASHQEPQCGVRGLRNPRSSMTHAAMIRKCPISTTIMPQTWPPNEVRLHISSSMHTKPLYTTPLRSCVIWVRPPRTLAAGLRSIGRSRAPVMVGGGLRPRRRARRAVSFADSNGEVLGITSASSADAVGGDVPVPWVGMTLRAVPPFVVLARGLMTQRGRT